VLPMARGQVPAALLLGLERDQGDHGMGDHSHDSHSQGDHDHPHDHDHDHDDHHDHSHVAMQSVALRLEGPVDRQALESLLRSQIGRQNFLRLKGRAWLAGKAQPLQIQAVGPRLECWFDPKAAAADQDHLPGLELVALGLQVDGAALEQELRALLGLA